MAKHLRLTPLGFLTVFGMTSFPSKLLEPKVNKDNKMTIPFNARLGFAPVHTAPRGDVLVVIFLRGAADALNMVVPPGDVVYYTLRLTLTVADFHLGGKGTNAAIRAATELQKVLAQMYAPTAPHALAQQGAQSLDVLQLLNKLDPSRKDTSLPYPQTDFGESLRQVGLLVKAEVGLEVAALDLGGWDTHFAQGSSVGWMANLLRELADGLAALYADVIDSGNRVSVVVMSEFGRRAHENGSLGTDHGHGGAMLLLGSQVRGKRVHGTWPGLQAEQLIGPGDLAVTTDYRDVLAELCIKQLNNPKWQQIFPGYTATFRDVFALK